MHSNQAMVQEKLVQSVEDSAASVIHCLTTARYLECLNANIVRFGAAVFAQTEADHRLDMLEGGDVVGAVLKQLKSVKMVDSDYLHMEYLRFSPLDFDSLRTEF